MTEAQVPAIQENFPLANMGDANLSEIVTENLGDETLSPFDLERVTIPPGGVTTWQLPDGTEAKELQGVIIKSQKTRSYWKEALSGGEGTPPDCVSPDCVYGYGDPGGECSKCPMNQFGTGNGGSSKACKETQHVFLLMQDNVLPVVLQIPPSSLKPFKKYLTRLVSKAKSVNSVVTSFTLKKEKSKGGIQYSEIVFNDVGNLSDDQYALVKNYREGLSKVLGGGEITVEQ